MQFKMKYHSEEYLKLYMIKYLRSLLSEVRAGILPLMIETGRFQKVTHKMTVLGTFKLRNAPVKSVTLNQ